MPEIGWDPDPPRERLLAGLRARLPELRDGLEVLACGLLGDDAPIDLVARTRDGDLLLALVGGPGDDLALVGLGLAQRSWVEARLDDWRALAPDLGLRAEAAVELLLLCPAFRPAARRAAAALGPGVDCAVYRAVRDDDRCAVLLEPVPPLEAPSGARAPAPRAAPETPPPFRSGLSDEDLGLTDAERGEFEGSESPRGDTLRLR